MPHTFSRPIQSLEILNAIVQTMQECGDIAHLKVEMLGNSMKIHTPFGIEGSGLRVRHHEDSDRTEIVLPPRLGANEPRRIVVGMDEENFQDVLNILTTEWKEIRQSWDGLTFHQWVERAKTLTPVP